VLVKGTARQQTPDRANRSAAGQHQEGLAAALPGRLADERECNRRDGGALVWYLLSPATLLPLATAIVLVVVLCWLQ
jgi:hypothetical protein